MLPIKLKLPVNMQPQPDETTCGPTCLNAIYRYWGDAEALDDVIARTRKFEHGGTFAVFLACDALRRGLDATIYTYNLKVFDPTWFAKPGMDIAERLQRQREVKHDARLALATAGYLDFLQLGGRLRFQDLTRPLIRGLLRRNIPILTGLSSTYLYRCAREYGPEDMPDDIRGTPSGHFVVIAGYNRKNHTLLIADPYGPHPFGPTHEYWINIDRVLGAVLLGIVTHDANLLVIHPRKQPKNAHA